MSGYAVMNIYSPERNTEGLLMRLPNYTSLVKHKDGYLHKIRLERVGSACWVSDYHFKLELAFPFKFKQSHLPAIPHKIWFYSHFASAATDSLDHRAIVLPNCHNTGDGFSLDLRQVYLNCK